LKKRLKKRKFSTTEEDMPAAASPTCSQAGVCWKQYVSNCSPMAI
jgi:hypothetical protein